MEKGQQKTNKEVQKFKKETTPKAIDIISGNNRKAAPGTGIWNRRLLTVIFLWIRGELMSGRSMIVRVVSFALLLAIGTTAAAAVFGIKSCGSAIDANSACNAGAVQGGGSMPPSVLFSFGESAGGLASTVTITDGTAALVHVDALAINGAGTLYAYILSTIITPITGSHVNANVTASQLVILNPATGAVTSSIGTALVDRDIRGAAFGPQGRLWTLDATGNQLLYIDNATGTIVSSVGLTLGGNPYDLTTASDIAIQADGTAIVVDLDNFYTVDLASGALTSSFSASGLGQGNMYAGIAFSATAADDLLFAYEATGAEDIRNFDLGDGNAETQQIGNFLPFFNGNSFNAGRGDLAAQVRFEENTVPVPGTFTLAIAGMMGWALMVFNRRR